MNKVTPPSIVSQKGITLIEILIAVVILSVGLIGAAGLQVMGLKSINISGANGQAAILAHHLAERIHVNRANIADYTTLSSGNCPVVGGSIAIATMDYCEVYAQAMGDHNSNGVNTDPGEVQLLRPTAGEYLEIDVLSLSLGTYTITINWKENDMSGTDQDRSYTFNFRP